MAEQLAMMMPRVLLVALVVLGLGCQARRAKVVPSLLGDETGLDHVGIAVKDLRVAQETFYARLGFDRPVAGHLPNGIDNINYYFEDATYLETLTFYDRKKADWLAWFIDHFTEGGNFFVLSTQDLGATAGFLRGRGIGTAPPSAGGLTLSGGQKGGNWRTMFLEGTPLPGSPLFFIEYPRETRQAFLAKLKGVDVRRGFFAHRNTAVGIREVWVAAQDLPTTARAYEALGLTTTGTFEDAALQARGVLLQAGQGRIALLSPTTGTGPVQDFLQRRGPGVLGVAIEVHSIDTAQRVLARGTGQTPEIKSGRLGPSITTTAHGAYITFFQPLSNRSALSPVLEQSSPTPTNQIALNGLRNCARGRGLRGVVQTHGKDL